MTEVIVDYAAVPDTPNYVDSNLIRSSNGCAMGVVSGELATSTDGTSSYYMPTSVLDLDTATEIIITQKNLDSDNINAVSFISSDLDPGNVHPLSTASMTGYRFHWSGGTLFIGRVISGSETNIGTASTSANNDSMKVVTTVNAGDVTLTFFKNDALYKTIVDSDAARITNFRTAGSGYRQAFGFGCELEAFIVDNNLAGGGGGGAITRRGMGLYTGLRL